MGCLLAKRTVDICKLCESSGWRKRMVDLIWSFGIIGMASEMGPFSANYLDHLKFWLIRHNIFLQMTLIIPMDWTIIGQYGRMYLFKRFYLCQFQKSISCETRTLSDCEDVRGSGVPAGWPTLSHNGGEPLFSLVSARSLQYGQHQSQGITKKEQNEIRL